MALPQPSQMLEKSGLKMSTEMLPSLINIVIPLGVNRTGLSRGVQVIYWFVLFLFARHNCLKAFAKSVYVNCNLVQNVQDCVPWAECGPQEE